MSDMLRKEIIVESSSAWLAPAVYTRKKTGEIRLCVDYCKVNKRTSKDAYPRPLIDEVQDRLSGAMVFSKLDHQCGYWQVPVDPKDHLGEDSILTWARNGAVPVHKDALWLVWDTQHIPEINGCRVARGPAHRATLNTVTSTLLNKKSSLHVLAR